MTPDIDLFVIRLRSSSGDTELLGPRERARAERLAIAHKRSQFVAAQAALRRILGGRLGIGAADVVFDYGHWGKPSVAGQPALGFNLTHSDDLALVAIGDHVEVGVDVEDGRRSRPFRRLARRYFAAAEQLWIDRLPDSVVAAGFYRTWTLKEAYLKALGTGLTVAPDRFELDLEADPAALTAAAPGFESHGPWCFAEPRVATEFAAAVCWAGEPRRLRLHEATAAGDLAVS